MAPHHEYFVEHVSKLYLMAIDAKITQAFFQLQELEDTVVLQWYLSDLFSFLFDCFRTFLVHGDVVSTSVGPIRRPQRCRDH